MKKVALVTGAGAGIGKSIALRLAEDGFNLVVNDLKSTGDTVAEVKARGVDCIEALADVSNEEAVAAMYKKVMDHYGRLDVLVNNAGICPIRTIDEVSAKNMETTYNINVVSMFINAKEAAQIMKEQPEGGKIINACSQSGFRETPVTFEYTTTKWSIRGMTKAMAQSLAKYGISVNAYCPGTILTPMQDRIAKQTSKEMHVPAFAVRKFQKLSQPLGRFQPVEEIADMVAFLASDRSDGINGQNILCNGGQVMN